MGIEIHQKGDSEGNFFAYGILIVFSIDFRAQKLSNGAQMALFFAPFLVFFQGRLPDI